MGSRWQLQEAKNRLSEVVRKAREVGPQVITVHGSDAVVVVSAEQFQKNGPRKGTLLEFFRNSPFVAEQFRHSRSRDTGRTVRL